MVLPQALLLGLVQGFAEFLPISSSGHLALIQYLWGIQNALSFDIVLHLGTLLAVIVLFRHTLKELILQTFQAIFSGKLNEVPKVVWWLIVGTIPAVIFGLLFKNVIEDILNSPKVIGIGFLITAGLLFFSSTLKIFTKNLKTMNWKDSLVIGIFQAIAIIPGISRSGATITSSLQRGLQREEAFRFSFLLAIPAILGAEILDAKALITTPRADIPLYFLGFMAAFVSGLIALKLVKKVIISNKFAWFGGYCLILGLITLLFA